MIKELLDVGHFYETMIQANEESSHSVNLYLYFTLDAGKWKPEQYLWMLLFWCDYDTRDPFFVSGQSNCVPY